MQQTYVAEHTAPDGTTAYRIVRVFGKATVDDVRAMLEQHGILPREIIRAPTGASLDAITGAITDPFKIMYMQGK
ncbi:hypothetical protein LJC74_09445 [Eubacteriales bacterium OttesenSCG-928-A19]|nr:hypothetical protein [Eubacteriales bacterium OttesenSCG-928-A19]